jgi:hypothetical protein
MYLKHKKSEQHNLTTMQTKSLMKWSPQDRKKMLSEILRHIYKTIFLQFCPHLASKFAKKSNEPKKDFFQKVLNVYQTTKFNTCF